MNEEQYQLLCKICDEILLEPDTTIERAANAWLHVLNEHPLSLAKYQGVFSGNVSKFIALKSMLYTLKQGKKLFKSSPKWFPSKHELEQADVIFISNILNASQVGDKIDFYFGDLPNNMTQKGIPCLVILHNHTGIESKYLLTKNQLNTAPRMMFSNTLSWKEELNIRTSLQKEANKLRNKAREFKNILYKRVLEIAAKNSMSMTSIFALRFYYQIKNIVEKVKPKAIVVLYEGHAWERLAFAAARSIFPGVRCIGYQHAILFPRQHALKRLLDSNLDPDVILTAGDISRDFLREVKSLRNISIITVGTHRQKDLILDIRKKILNLQDNACLIIPDGNMCECLTIINYSIQVAGLLPGIRFIIRMHPLLKFEDVVKQDKRFKKLPKNIEVSHLSLDEDFNRCRWAIYRGSGAAIHAVIAGLRPFYLALPNELNIDPLYGLTIWKHIISTPGDFVSYINYDTNVDVGSLNAKYQEAQNYCNKYFMPVNEQVFFNEIIDLALH